ncbi:MAG: type II secretion system protein [Mycobacterium leprae]
MRISGEPREAGFTLIELMVVVAIIALLTAFALPRLIRAVDDSRHVVGDGDLRTLETALERYHLDEPDNTFPHGTEADIRAALASYLRPGGRADTAAHLTNGHYESYLITGAGRGYVYLFDPKGQFFIVVDPGKAPVDTELEVTCGDSTNQATDSVSVGRVFRAIAVTHITKDHVASGCTLPVDLTDLGFALITN